jgi:hypothetical protein
LGRPLSMSSMQSMLSIPWISPIRVAAFACPCRPRIK